MEKKLSSEDLQQAYLQLQMIEQQLKDIEAQIVDVENRRQEISIMGESLEELKNIKKNSSTFSPLGLGIFVKSKILETTELLVNVGSNIFVNKPISDISKSLDKQIKKFDELSKTLTQNYQILVVQNQALQTQLQSSIGGN